MMSCQYVLLLLSAVVSAVEVQRPRGVPLSKRQFYEEDKPFTCLDGLYTIPYDRVNDDYCDCKDGSDEPGTAACPNGSFHCTNAGFRPTFIPSSRINDGICDCCDTTDEYNSGASCQNTCREQGRKERESLQKMAEIAKEGFVLKQQLIQEANRGLEDKKTKLSEVQDSRKDLEDKVETLRTVKESAEEPERKAKERHLKAWEDEKDVIRMQNNKNRMTEVFLELDDDADGFVSVTDLLSHSELDGDSSDGSFTEEEAQALLGGVDNVDLVAFESVWNNIKEKYISEMNTDTPAPQETPMDEMSETPMDDMSETVSDNDSEQYPEEDIPEEDEEDDEQDEDDDPDEADYKNPPAAQTQEKKDDTDDEGTMPPYDEQTQNLIDDAQNARNEFDEAERTLREVDDQIGKLEKEISFDFGPSAEFTYLYSQCYELTTNEYIYRLCPFNRVSQKSKYGGSETNLGTWGKWAGPEDNVYSVMRYEQGTGCWQGPNRSTSIKLTCGKETVVISTSEPSRCEYLMEFTTPAVCKELPSLDSVIHEHAEL